MFSWWRAGSPQARKALVAAGLGWMLDAFDVMLYALVLAAIIAELGMSKETAGALGSLTLLASAAGGVIFGLVADRFGRTRALIASVLIYSVFTAACGLAQTVAQLAIFRIFLGLGMGGEWASGAALVSETWPAEHRGKALGFMQSAWAIGYGAAAIVTALVMPVWGWRAVFFVGVLPAFFTLWVRRNVEEPEIWRETRRVPAADRGRFGEIFRRPMLPLTIAVTVMNAFTMFAWWGFNLWLPGYLSLPR
jgi:MFS family permease